MPVLGVDVSHHQGAVAWSEVARSAVKFAYCKATEGAVGIDPTFDANWAALGATPLLRGAYHFARPGGGKAGAEQQAEHFAWVVDASQVRALPPVLDIERDGGLEPEAVIDWVRAFVSRAEFLFERELMIYTGRLWRETLGNPVVPEIGTRMLWTARYGTQEPVVPATWQKWDFWQFTDGQSGDVQFIPGIKGLRCDCNRFRGSLEELTELTRIA